jgi:hypothetical protein
MQRAYRARLAAAGRSSGWFDAVPVSPALGSPTLASIPDFDPATQFVGDRKMV